MMVARLMYGAFALESSYMIYNAMLSDMVMRWAWKTNDWRLPCGHTNSGKDDRTGYFLWLPLILMHLRSEEIIKSAETLPSSTTIPTSMQNSTDLDHLHHPE